MKIISVVRDFEMYNLLVKNNIYNAGAEFFFFDNRVENKYISTRYNEFLESYDYSKPDWLVFCHEDWEVKENIALKLTDLDTGNLYGPIGKELDVIYGQIIHSSKTDLSKASVIGKYCYKPRLVGTFDCQCLIVHSDLIKKYNLRFDENLSFDLYVEDFCINAKENFGIKSFILQIACHHHSVGSLQKRYDLHFKYLQQKYNKINNPYFSTASTSMIGKLNFSAYFKMYLLKYIYETHVTKSGRYIVKICKIPVLYKKIKNKNEMDKLS